MEREEVGDGQTAAGLTVVLAEGEERDVRFQEVDRLLPMVVELDLKLDRISLEVDEPASSIVLGPRLCASVEIDDQLGRGVDPLKALLAHPVDAAVVVERVVGPPVLESESGESVADEPRSEGGAVVLLGPHEHSRRSRMCLDVVRVEAEPTETNEVVERLPDDPGHGGLGHHPQHDELTALAVHALAASAATRRRRRRCCASCSWR